MAIAFGTWLKYFPFVPSSRSPEPKKERNRHYTFDVDDNGLDINGFVVHAATPSQRRHKFRVFLDSNENGRFDKNDPSIGRTGLQRKHAAKGVGNLLDDDEIGQVMVNFKKSKSNASMSSDPQSAHTTDDLTQPLDDSSQPEEPD